MKKSKLQRVWIIENDKPRERRGFELDEEYWAVTNSLQGVNMRMLPAHKVFLSAMAAEETLKGNLVKWVVYGRLDKAVVFRAKVSYYTQRMPMAVVVDTKKLGVKWLRKYAQKLTDGPQKGEWVLFGHILYPRPYDVRNAVFNTKRQAVRSLKKRLAEEVKDQRRYIKQGLQEIKSLDAVKAKL